MSRSSLLRRLAVAACAIVAIALVAATIRSPLETGSDGTGGGSGGGEGDGVGQPAPPESAPDASVPAFLEYLIVLLLVVLALAIVWYLLAHRREAVKLIAIGLVVLFVTAVLVYAVMTVLPFVAGEFEPPEQFSESGEGGGGEGGSSGSEEDTSFSTGPMFVLLALLTAIFLGGLFLSRESGGAEDRRSGSDLADDDSRVDGETTAAVGTAAGAAADRLEDTDEFDNAVYRAWREMTQPLEVDRPDSSTPREFARAATDAGMDRTDVDELTRLFEDVRYGDAPTTPEREARAIEVLRRIESEYADPDSDSNDGRIDPHPVEEHRSRGENR
ncbi:DUF4129 domain-containing protein [Natronorubrum texcoconense]|uniref:Protein-glutamine gamma-glutamyltransferase-like C-terminal domain-containing protein n=1 Tax=Natronorubrum texcoconense TaxID=1095776 RepID=A0A1G8V524_9EURY|nr:DUF4129 domain-containing protein [Natronorubrum texcoconense]SDJ60944.1 protein of unknown function [Natronorubrum texcoconense]